MSFLFSQLCHRSIVSLDLMIWSFFWWTIKIKQKKSDKSQCQEDINVLFIHASRNLLNVQLQFYGRTERTSFTLKFLIMMKPFKTPFWQRIKSSNLPKRLIFQTKRHIKCNNIRSTLVLPIFIIIFFSKNQ